MPLILKRFFSYNGDKEDEDDKDDENDEIV